MIHSADMEEPKIQHICTEFPNLVIITNSKTMGYIQLNFVYDSVGNKSPGGS